MGESGHHFRRKRRHGHYLQQQIGPGGLPPPATQSANNRDQEQGEQYARQDGRGAHCQGGLAQHRAKGHHGPDHQRWLIEVAPVEVSRAIPIVGFVSRKGKDGRAHDPDQRQHTDDQKILLHRFRAEVFWAALSVWLASRSSCLFSDQSSRSVWVTVEVLTVVLPSSLGRCWTATWAQLWPANLARA